MNFDQREQKQGDKVRRRLEDLSPGRRDLLKRVLGREVPEPETTPIQPRDPATGAPPLSRAQEAMWVVSQLTGGGVYNLPAAVRLRGPLHIDALRGAVDAMVERHEILRTTFPDQRDKAGRLVQIVHPRLGVELPLLDCPEAEVAARAGELCARDFDLAAGPLFRLVLFRIASDDHVLLSVWHHLIWDGWSIGVFTGELAALYDALRRGQASPLPPLPLQFADVALWEREAHNEDALRARADWWVEQLADQVPAELPGDRPRPAMQSFAGALHFVDWPGERVRRLNAFCAEAGSTLYMTLLAAFAVLLMRWSERERITIGTPAANRQRPEVAGLIGYFANILPLPVDCSADPSFRTLVQRVREMAGEAFARQDVPFETLVERSGVARDPARNPLFQIMFALHAESLDDLRLPGLSLTPFPLGNSTTHFDLGLHLWRRGERLGGYLSYAGALFEPETIARLCRALAILVDDALARPDTPISELRLLDAEERAWLRRRAEADADGAPADAARDAEQGRYPSGIRSYVYRPPEVAAAAAIDGRPLLPMRILDAHGRPRPIGVPGRVEVDGVATHDLGRWRADGTLEIMGPLDRTDWIGGERRFLADLEAELCRMPAVSDARLSVRPDGAWVVWVVARGPLDPARIEQRLAPIKPEVTAVLVDRLALDGDGRVDEAALARVEAIDERLAARWRRALTASPGIDGARVVARPREYSQGLLHAAKLLAGERRHLDGCNAEAPAAPSPRVEHRDAFADGGPLQIPEDAPRTLVDALLRTAEGPLGEQRGLTLIERWGQSGAEERRMSYAELLAAARRALSGLCEAGLGRGDRVLLQLATLADHFALFWGCVLGGMIPVCVARAPVYDRKNSVLNKLFGTWQALGRPPIITNAISEADLHGAARLYDARVRLLTAESLLAAAPATELHSPSPDAVVFLQLTSGSTGTPKCIQETHDGIIHHIHGSARACGYGPEDVTVNWLPMDHVVPILTFHLKDTYLGIRQLHARPEVVLADPLRWLDLLESKRATHTWAPNFGFELVNRALTESHGRSWDLAPMRAFMNAGEQVTLPVCSSFVRRLAPFGVQPQAMQPAFGMAECCTCMTYANDFTPATGAHPVIKASLGGHLQAGEGIDFVDLGPPMPGVQIRIADEQGGTLPERVIGRFQIRGRVVTPGYLDNEAANQEAFPGDGWLDSGDLGFIDQGRLSLTGRAKEMIVLRGANFHCHEIEAVVNADADVLPTYAAACGVPDGAGGDGLGIFFVPKDAGDAPGQVQLVRRLAEAVTREIGARPQFVLPLERDGFPRTTSGKIQRTRLREQLAEGLFDEALQALDLALGNPGTLPDWFFRELWRPCRLDGAARVPTRISVLGDGDGLGIESVPIEQAELAIDLRPLRSDDPGAVLGLLQHLGAMDRELRLLIVATGALALDARDVAPKAWLRGLLKSAAQEWPKMQLRLLDIAAGLPVAEVLAGELSAREPEVAWRAGDGGPKRLVPRLERIVWDQPRHGPLASGQLLLVSGGLGGMGVEICRLLLEQYGCSLLLVGRSDLAAEDAAEADIGLAQRQSMAERRAALAELESLGDLLYRAADVADGDAMADAVAAAEAHFGRALDGALHLAGSFPARLLAEESPETLAATLHPKLRGARVIDALLGEDGFLVLAGSVYGTFGGVAAGAYSAAGSALQGLAEERHRRGKATWCLAFSNWDEVGMSRGYAYRERSQALGYCMIERQRGLESLQAALTLADPFVLIGLDAGRANVRRLLTGAPEPPLELVGVYAGDGDASRLEVADALGRASRCELRRVSSLAGVDGEDIAELSAAGPMLPRNKMEETIAGCWRKVLDLPEIDIDRTFFELGGQSLQLVQVVARLQTTLGRDIAAVDMFRYPTVRSLAGHLATQGEPAKRTFDGAAARAEKQRQAMRRRPRRPRRG